jgi:hypothetical protein
MEVLFCNEVIFPYVICYCVHIFGIVILFADNFVVRLLSRVSEVHVAEANNIR